MLVARLARTWHMRAMRAGRARAVARAEARHCSTLALRFSFCLPSCSLSLPASEVSTELPER